MNEKKAAKCGVWYQGLVSRRIARQDVELQGYADRILSSTQLRRDVDWVAKVGLRLGEIQTIEGKR